MRLKLETGLAGGISEGFDLAVVASPATVKNDLLDSLADSGLRCESADRFCAGSVRGEVVSVRHGVAGCLGRNQRRASGIINELNVNVLVRETNAHAWTFFGATDLFADAPVAANGESMFLFSAHKYYWTVLPSLRTTRSSV